MTHDHRDDAGASTQTEAPAAGPLAGLRVLELGMLIAGPFAGRLLADLGADVIKIEAPDRPDPLREWGQVLDEGRSLWWPTMARNKRCITLDLRRPEGQEVLLDLVGRSHALLESFRPGTLERWGLPAERLHAANEDLVVVRLSGFGQTGPYRERPGFASVAEAMSGLRSVNGSPGDLPPRYGISLGDSLAGLFAALGLLAGLHGDTRGEIVDVSILEACFALLESAVSEYDRTGHVRQPSGTRLEGITPSNVFRSADGIPVIIAANQDSLFRRLCAAMDRPELADDPRFETHQLRYRHQDAIEAEIAAWASTHTAAELERRLADAGVVCGPINSIAEAMRDPHVLAREMLVEHTDGRPLLGPGIVPRFTGNPGVVRWSGPREPGAHNDDVYGGLLGLDERERRRLREAAVI